MAKISTITGVKGFRDILPPESARWAALERTAAEVFGRYGFGEIRLALLERAELFARSLGETTDIVEKEMYAFEDRDGSLLTLRPEATAGVVRAFVESGLVSRDPTARLWYAGPMFRRERPQKGRYRQFYQIGAEAFGRQDPTVDAEILEMLSSYLTAVGVQRATLTLNSLGDATCRPVYRQRLEDFARVHLDGLCGDCHRRLERNPLRLLDCKVEGCRAIMERAPVPADSLCAPCREHFDTVRALLDAEQVPYAVSPRLVRGLDYYCRTAFEVIAEGLGSQNAVGGGGRYDGLVAAIGGGDVPGVGFAIGLDRLAMILDAETAVASGPAAVILPLAEAAIGPAFRLATRLRAAGLTVGVEAGGRSLKSLMRAADRQRAGVAVLIGDAELQAGAATIRDLVRRLDRPQALPLDASGDVLVAALTAAPEPAPQ